MFVRLQKVVSQGSWYRKGNIAGLETGVLYHDQMKGGPTGEYTSQEEHSTWDVCQRWYSQLQKTENLITLDFSSHKIRILEFGGCRVV